MKRLSQLIILAALISFTSCTKNSIFEVEAIPSNPITETADQSKESLNTSEEITTSNAGQGYTTLHLQVANASEVNGELIINFSSILNLAGVIVDDTQYLNFRDGSGNKTTLAFQVNSYTGGNGTLQAAFDIGSHNLSGLDEEDIQSIIIRDDIIN